MIVKYIAIAYQSFNGYRIGDQLTTPQTTEKECLDYMIENFEGHLMFEIKKVYIIEKDNFVGSN